MPSRSEQTEMVYYSVEIRDMRNIFPPKDPSLHRECECPRFSCSNNNRTSVPWERTEKLSNSLRPS